MSTHSRRDWLVGLGATGATGLLATAKAEAAPAKPLTTASLAQSLLRLADKAELQGMRREAQAIYAAVKVVMDGTPVNGKGRHNDTTQS